MPNPFPFIFKPYTDEDYGIRFHSKYLVTFPGNIDYDAYMTTFNYEIDNSTNDDIGVGKIVDGKHTFIVPYPTNKLGKGLFETYVLDGDSLNKVHTFTNTHGNFYQDFGKAIITLDLNGDGHIDVGITSPTYETVDLFECGALFIYLNSNDKLIYNKDPIILTGKVHDARFGINAERAGDINGDRIEDFFVAALKNEISSTGCIYVYLGSKTNNYDSPIQILYPENFKSLPGHSGFGFKMNIEIDINSDRTFDLAVSSVYESILDIFRKRPLLEARFTITSNKFIPLNGVVNEIETRSETLTICTQNDDIKNLITVNLELEIKNSHNRVSFDRNSDLHLKELTNTKFEQSGCISILYYIRMLPYYYKEKIVVDLSIQDSMLITENCQRTGALCPIIISFKHAFEIKFDKQCQPNRCETKIQLRIISPTNLHEKYLTYDKYETMNIDLSIINLGSHLHGISVVLKLSSVCDFVMKDEKFQLFKTGSNNRVKYLVAKVQIPQNKGTQDHTLSFPHQISCKLNSRVDNFDIHYSVSEFDDEEHKFTLDQTFGLKYDNYFLYSSENTNNIEFDTKIQSIFTQNFSFTINVYGSSKIEKFPFKLIHPLSEDLKIISNNLESNIKFTDTCIESNDNSQLCSSKRITFEEVSPSQSIQLNISLEFEVLHSKIIDIKYELNVDDVIKSRMSDIEKISFYKGVGIIRLIPTKPAEVGIPWWTILLSVSGALLFLVLFFFFLYKSKIHRKIFPKYDLNVKYTIDQTINQNDSSKEGKNSDLQLKVIDNPELS